MEITEQKDNAPDSFYEIKTANELLSELSNNKQKFETTIKFDDTPPEASEEEKKAEQEKTQANINMNNLASSVLVDSGDRAIGWGLSLIALDNDIDKFCADKESRDNLKELVRAMMPKNMTVIPPWVQLVIMFPLIYGPKLKQAMELRKLNKENREHKKEIDRLKRQLEIQNLRTEAEKIKGKLEKEEQKQEIKHDNKDALELIKELSKPPTE